MAAVLDLVTFLVVLKSACCAQPRPAQDKMSPIINMQLDSRKKMLTWTSTRNVSGQECTIDTPTAYSATVDPQVTEDHTYVCTFPNSVLHRGANLTVNITCEGDVFLQVLTFANPGREGSGAVNFSCLIYNVRFMNCSWAPGPAAPADVKYRLFSWASRHEAESECVHYILGPTGTRVGCHFDQLGEPQRTDNYFFLVNGTSRETAIPFLDFTPFNAVQIEKYNPPRNITITYNRSHHIIRWEPPEIRFDLSSHMLYYELEIQTPASSAETNRVFQRGQDPNVYLMPGAATRAKSAFRVRVRYMYNRLWSEWSPTRRFGLPEQDFSGALVGPVVGTAALSALVLMFLCKRCTPGLAGVRGRCVSPGRDAQRPWGPSRCASPRQVLREAQDVPSHPAGEEGNRQGPHAHTGGRLGRGPPPAWPPGPRGRGDAGGNVLTGGRGETVRSACDHLWPRVVLVK
ncbi:granulocyte-macrophage colony-stimulating factor receptor subunit alpha-like isoform X1 [Leopardus geoffroyi]|uniref:granulocyte-macrophage colony-stimulating factor receptor subunit alpha-like isoform X1 n=1 Tax=Leopardus geoffroyi TaxID=46844 RepID=UPI001E26100E|nr:granulocyte-macrophage colony-stimulating factor receptor subunit alpha-like isoform X1 [Leopardus geoffroyi]XP_045327869.1 granulocyte-macrophage colony-stimulating factor receptor subunit alpha-like isoform X1 [Leopardus geoffroyi]